MEKVRVGIIGCGMISDIYLKNITTVFSGILQPLYCADINGEAAGKRAEEYHLQTCTVEEMFEKEDVELILNLTVPAAHYEIEKKALEAGKCVYSEKPVALETEEARRLMELAEGKGLLIGCSPDTVLGGGIQKAKALLESGIVGEPVSAEGICLSFGPEVFHPNAEFLYKRGAGPLLDMGPYWVTALVTLLGPCREVAGMAKRERGERTLCVGENAGKKFVPEVPTHIISLLRFEHDIPAALTVSFDTPFPYFDQKLPYIQINCTAGTIRVTDPNAFGGTVQVRKAGMQTQFEDYPAEGDYCDNSRGLGLANLALAMRGCGTNYASGRLACHVLEVLNAILTSVDTGRFVRIESTVGKPGLMEMNFDSKE